MTVYQSLSILSFRPIASGDAPKQRDGGVREIIERQQQRRGQLLMPGKLQQTPAEQ